jgi:hypothetical protein
VLGVCDEDTGQVSYYVGTSKTNLTPAQQAAAAKNGLKVVPNTTKVEHAEEVVIKGAKADAATNPVAPIAIYSNNPFCRENKRNCSAYVQSEGGQVVPPTPPKRLPRAAIWPPGYRWGPE